MKHLNKKERIQNIRNQLLRKEFVDASIAILVLLQDLGNCKLKVFLCHMLSSFPQSVHAYIRRISSKNMQM